MQDSEAVRIATTEALFRDVNERIGEHAAGEPTDRVAFVCECGDRQCTHRVDTTLDEYEDVRAAPNRFLVVDGHEDERIEEVVAERPGHNVVEKVQYAARATAERLDPRAAAV